MSKLGDAIRRSQRVEAAPMGFGAARPAQRPSMLVGFMGPEGDLAAAVSAGADFALVESSGTPDAKGLRTSAGSLPLGIASAIADSEAAKTLQEGGVDALLVNDSTPAAALLNEDLGYVLTLPAGAEELYLRSLDSLNLEAVLLETIPSPLTVAAQIELGRIAGLARKPLLCKATPGLSKDDLQCLRAAGCVGLLTDAGSIASLKESVAALPLKKQRKEDRAVVSLPRGGQAAAEEHEEEDE